MSVSLESETVGQLTERYIDDEHRSQQRSVFLEAVLSILGLVIGVAGLLGGALPLGDNAVSLVAAFAALVGLGVVMATWSIARSVQRRARSNEEQPLPRSLLAFRQQLHSMRRPLLERSVALTAHEKKR